MKGQKILHRVYGKGIIVGTDGNYITICFISGEKRLPYSEVFPSISGEKVKSVHTQIKSEQSINEKEELNTAYETKDEAAKRRYRERIAAEKREIESIESARLAAKIQAIKREDKARIGTEKRVAENIATHMAKAKRLASEKKEAERMLSEKRAIVRAISEIRAAENKEKERKLTEKWAREREERERIAALKREADRIVVERQAEARREDEKRTALLFEEQRKNLKESRIKIRTSQENKFKEILNKREIKYLFHFTRVDNLNSILQNGLVPVNLQPEMKISSIHNDEKRYDSQLDCTSFSIGFPNYKLFFTFRKKFPETKWALILIDANVILSTANAVYFCQTNAAHVFHRVANIEELCELHAFEKMFSGTITTSENKTINRENLCIRDDYSTDPQAEILISDIIPPSLIKCVCFPSPIESREYINIFGSDFLNKFTSRYTNKFFTYRKDYEFWKTEKKNGETDLLYL